jgi:hypothetical protein
MTTPSTLDILKKRVEQVCAYQEIKLGRTVTGGLAHFTKWEACCSMLAQAKALVPPAASGEPSGGIDGVSLWAGDAHSLNDPLEGQALLLFAQLIANGELRDRDFVTGKYSEDRRTNGPAEEDDHADLPHLAAAKWTSLFKALKKIYPNRISHIVSGSPSPEPIIGSDTYLVSFCRDADRLDLWRAYGDSAEGICLVMPLEQAVRALEAVPEWGFYRVAYDERSKTRAWAVLHQPVIAAVDKMRDLPSDEKKHQAERIRTILNPVHYLFKHEQFRTEREVRLIRRPPLPANAKRKPGDSGTYLPTEPFFLSGAGCKIILGPKCPDQKIRAAVLRSYLQDCFSATIPVVERSGVPFQ